jgi:acetolactate synthase-1/2/3 large subunit
VAILGGSRWSEQAVRVYGVCPGAASGVLLVPPPDAVPATHACYGGDLGLGVNPSCWRASGVDLVLVVGGRLSEVPSQGYELFAFPPAQPLVHVHADADELGKLYRPRQAIHATPQAFCSRALPCARRPPCHGRPTPSCACRLSGLERPCTHPHSRPLQMGEVMQHLRMCCPPHHLLQRRRQLCHLGDRFWPFTTYASQLAPTSGSMGYGLPAGVGASACGRSAGGGFAGDGDF